MHLLETEQASKASADAKPGQRKHGEVLTQLPVHSESAVPLPVLFCGLQIPTVTLHTLRANVHAGPSEARVGLGTSLEPEVREAVMPPARWVLGTDLRRC